MVAEPVIQVLWCSVVMATAQEVELLRCQLEELNVRMEEVRQQSANAAMNAAVSEPTDAVRTMGQSVSKPRPGPESWKARAVSAPGKDFDDWDCTFKGCAGALDPIQPC